jgi:hypothetical protein
VIYTRHKSHCSTPAIRTRSRPPAQSHLPSTPFLHCPHSSLLCDNSPVSSSKDDMEVALEWLKLKQPLSLAQTAGRTCRTTSAAGWPPLRLSSTRACCMTLFHGSVTEARPEEAREPATTARRGAQCSLPVCLADNRGTAPDEKHTAISGRPYGQRCPSATSGKRQMRPNDEPYSWRGGTAGLSSSRCTRGMLSFSSKGKAVFEPMCNIYRLPGVIQECMGWLASKGL